MTAKDFEVQTFCTGGAGGQHRNAKKNGVRIIHTASGARAEHRDGRDQDKNKQEAFYKLTQTDKFKKWHKAETARRLGQDKLLEEKLDVWLRKENFKTEVKDATGRWQIMSEIE